MKFLILLIALTLPLFSDEIVFTDMKEHKEKCLAKIVSNPKNKDPFYPLRRVTLTLSADDVDYIPKHPDAGKVFEEDGLKVQLMHNGIKILEHSYYAAWMT